MGPKEYIKADLLGQICHAFDLLSLNMVRRRLLNKEEVVLFCYIVFVSSKLESPNGRGIEKKSTVWQDTWFTKNGFEQFLCHGEKLR